MEDQNQPQLMEGFEDKQNFRFPGIEKTRWDRPLKVCSYVAKDTAARVRASKEQFPPQFFRGDCHSHTQHSDGIGTVAETAAMMKAAELDFQFVTDHWGVTQAPECREHGLWVGQEPVTQHHHMGVLGLDYAFTPQMDFLADLARAAQLGATVFVPHPCGWWPDRVYNEEQKQALDEVPSPFLMEICNGANNIVSAFDYTDEAAVAIWDHLLMQGKTVHALGNTDAHEPHGIGIVWNGVFAATCEQDTILAALRSGHSFVSDAPLVHLALGEARMGDRALNRDGALEIVAVDSRGLNSLRVVADGKEIFYHHFRGETVCRESVAVPDSVEKYVRVEVRSNDGRRAFSNPIYL